MSPNFRKKPNFQNGQKGRENRTNMDIILIFLAKPLDKHGITLVHISYPPVIVQYVQVAEDMLKPCKISHWHLKYVEIKQEQ